MRQIAYGPVGSALVTPSEAAAQPLYKILDYRPNMADVTVTGHLTDKTVGTDDGPALNAALAALAGTNRRLTLPHRGTGVLMTTVAIVKPIGVSLDCNGVQIVGTDALDGSPIFTAGAASPSSDDRSSIYELDVTRCGIGAWQLGNDDAAIRLIRQQKHNFLQIIRWGGKSRGVQIYGDGGPGQYDQLFLGQGIDNEYGVHLLSVHALGSINELKLRGGSIRVSSTTNTAKDRYGVVMEYSGAGYQSHNDSKFDFSFELNPSGAGGIIAQPYWIKCGQRNDFGTVGDRDEANTAPFVKFEGVATKNRVRVGWSDKLPSQMFSDISTSGDNRLESIDTPWGMGQANGWSSGNLVDKFYAYNSTDMSVVGPLFMKRSTSSIDTIIRNRVFSQYKIRLWPEPHIEIASTGSDGIGLILEVVPGNAYVAWQKCVASFGGRRYLMMMDANMRQIDAVANPTFIQSASLTSTFSSYGGAFRVGADSDTPTIFRVLETATTVKYVAIVWGGGTAAAKLKEVGVFAFDGHRQYPMTVKGDPKYSPALDGIKVQGVASVLHGLFNDRERIIIDTATGASGNLREHLVTTAGRGAPARVDATTYAQGEMYASGGNVFVNISASGLSGTGTAPGGAVLGTDYTDGALTVRFVRALAATTAQNSP